MVSVLGVEHSRELTSTAEGALLASAAIQRTAGQRSEPTVGYHHIGAQAEGEATALAKVL